MKRITTIIGLAAAALACAYQFGDTNATIDQRGLNVSWAESNLQESAKMNYNVSADALASYGCITKSGKLPADKKKQITISAQVTRSIIAATDENGDINVQLRLPLPSPGTRLICPTGLAVTVGTVSYRNVTVHNTIAGTAFAFPGTFARTFRTFNQ